MSDLKNYNVYDLVNEINKNNDSSDNKLDSIFNALDNDTEITTDKKVEVVKESKVNYTLNKPSFHSKGSKSYSRYERFNEYINEVDYGTNNNPTYMQGHKTALTKYSNIYKLNEKEGYLVEATLSEEIKSYNANNYEFYNKGYYDGLMYVYEALKTSKQETIDYIGDTLKREL